MKTVVVDIETEKVDLDKGELPKHIWLVVFKDIKNNIYSIFRNVTENLDERKRCIECLTDITRSPHLLLGHNVCGFDWPVLLSALELSSESIHPVCLDTLIISKLVDYPRKGHSIEDYGEEFGIPKGDNKGADFFKGWSQELEDYCIRDVDICEKIYLKYAKYINNPAHRPSIDLEHRFQLVVNDLTKNGFAFNSEKAKSLLSKVEENLKVLDGEIERQFPPRLKPIREITPKVTKHGTLSKTDFRWVSSGDLSEYNGYPFTRCEWVSFNPSSHKQLVEILNGAGWKPTDRTQTHIDTEREYKRLAASLRASPYSLKHSREEVNPLDLEKLSAKLDGLAKTGWKISEENLATLPDKAPAAARSLAKRIMLEARRRTLTEWLELVREDVRIHGKFNGIGAWTHRMNHQKPNTANIPNEFDTNGITKLLGKEMRQLWRAPKNRLLVGVDAEAIQLRVFAHYINDAEFTHALVEGKKADKTDPHSLNQSILGSVCKSRNAAKRYIFALLLGAGHDKLAQILNCSKSEAEAAFDNLISRYTGLAELKRTVIPADAKRGWFTGLDGRKVRIPGLTAGERKHLCMSGYLQTGEAVIMKMATLKWYEKLKHNEELDWKLVNFVHDEWQTEVNNNMELALFVAKSQADALREVGEELKLNCPLAGSYWNDDHHDYTIGTNWYQTH